MHKTLLPFSQIPQISKTDLAYVSGDERLSPFYTYRANAAELKAAAQVRAGRSYPRADLVAVLEKQYSALPLHHKVQQNIAALAADSTFCVTTAHQPTLLLGPLYFVYKALSAICLAEEAERQLGNGTRTVPVFVLGSEDHDLEELNHVRLFGKTLKWTPAETGAVGSMGASSLRTVLEELRTLLGESEAAQHLYARVERCYGSAGSFAEATQALLHELMGKFGLVVLNMNDPLLKKHAIPIFEAELLDKTAHRLVRESIAALSALGFKAQAQPREINLFYMLPGIRERIVETAEGFEVLNTDLRFTKTEMLATLREHPERFSPNVVLRPLFQDMVLPSLAYVGGGGELAYWLERKTLFAHYQVPFPMLVRRHSALLLDADAQRKLAKLGFGAAQFFADTDALVRQYVEKNAAAEVHLDAEIAAAKDLYAQLAQKAKAIDPTLEKAVLAEQTKTVAGLEHWQGRLIRAEKLKHETAIGQLRALKEKLFPGGGLQERHDNVLPYLLKYGDGFLDGLHEVFLPFEDGFLLVEI
jgi:bacillithiol biosynthesis cysteine-adding enzyme BshC